MEDIRKQLQINDIIKDDASQEYVITSFIGHGGSSLVYKAKDSSGITVLIKELFPLYFGVSRGNNNCIVCDSDASANVFEKYQHRLKKEYLILKELRTEENDPYYFQIKKPFFYNNTWYTVMEYKKGHMLSDDQDSFEGRKGLSEICHIIKMILKATSKMHGKGYLHLDISADNVFLSSYEQEAISYSPLLIDYNSAIKKDDKKNIETSLKKGYSAPELELKQKDALCFATDLFSVAAIMFRLIYKQEWDILFSDWENEKIDSFFFNICRSGKEKFLSIIKKGLAISVKHRYTSCGEFEKDIDELIKYVDSEKPFIKGGMLPVKNPMFLGRQEELSAICNVLEQSHRITLIGDLGIGKTELAIEYAHQYKDKYDSISFLQYESSLYNTIGKLSFGGYGSDLLDTNEKLDYLVSSKDKILVVIDNYAYDGSDLLDFSSENIDIIITTELQDLGRGFGEKYEICPLPADTLHNLVKQRYCFECSEASDIGSLITYFEGNTLIIGLIAEILKNSDISPAELLDTLKNGDIESITDNIELSLFSKNPKTATVYEHIKSLIDLQQFSEYEQYVLINLSLINNEGINRKVFREILNLPNNNIINKLIRDGFIQITDTKQIFIKNTAIKYAVISSIRNPFEHLKTITSEAAFIFDSLTLYFIVKKFMLQEDLCKDDFSNFALYYFSKSAERLIATPYSANVVALLDSRFLRVCDDELSKGLVYFYHFFFAYSQFFVSDDTTVHVEDMDRYYSLIQNLDEKLLDDDKAKRLEGLKRDAMSFLPVLEFIKLLESDSPIDSNRAEELLSQIRETCGEDKYIYFKCSYYMYTEDYKNALDLAEKNNLTVYMLTCYTELGEFEKFSSLAEKLLDEPYSYITLNTISLLLPHYNTEIPLVLIKKLYNILIYHKTFYTLGNMDSSLKLVTLCIYCRNDLSNIAKIAYINGAINYSNEAIPYIVGDDNIKDAKEFISDCNEWISNLKEEDV